MYTVCRGTHVNSADQKVQCTLKVRRGVTGKVSHDRGDVPCTGVVANFNVIPGSGRKSITSLQHQMSCQTSRSTIIWYVSKSFIGSFNFLATHIDLCGLLIHARKELVASYSQRQHSITNCQRFRHCKPCRKHFKANLWPEISSYKPL